MNDSERTPSKEAKLKLKGFHKRQIIIKAVKNLFVKRKVDKPKKKMKGSGSGGRGEITGRFSYILEKVSKNKIKQTTGEQFNKQQLPGKLIIINGKYFRIKK